jgi:hypothetical protein
MTALQRPQSTGGAAPRSGGERRGGPPGWIAVLGVGGLVLGIALVAAQALGLGVRVGAPATTIAPAGPDARLARDLVARALSEAALQVNVDPQVPYRPAESSGLGRVPRLLLQVVLPTEPTAGFVVIYDLPDGNSADRAGRDFAAYLASGTGAIQYPRDEQFVIRRSGSALVFFAWSPTADTDPAVPVIAAALEGVGVALGG